MYPAFILSLDFSIVPIVVLLLATHLIYCFIDHLHNVKFVKIKGRFWKLFRYT